MIIIKKAFFRLFLVTIIASVISFALFPTLKEIFFHNIILNSVISGVLILGVMVNFFNLYSLRKDVGWLDAYDHGREDFPDAPKPQSLSPIAIVMKNTKDGAYLSSTAVRSLLMSIETRLSSQRELSRYITGILIFLGLLGTFWGLSKTIGAVAAVVSHLQVSGQDVASAFQNLKNGIQSPLSGMGVAFSSSLLGLSGSLLIGALDLQIQSAYKTFYEQIEDRLTACIRTFSQEIDAPAGGPAYTQGLLEQAVESMVQLQVIIKNNEQKYGKLFEHVKDLSESISKVQSQQEKYVSDVSNIISSQQITNQEMIKSVSHLKNIDSNINNIIDEMNSSQSNIREEIRNETRLVARTISSLGKQRNNAA